jgi:3-hydroxyisobutyrate dehydrogenase-like beta-hydroxyacid dehydrogenase
MAGKLLDAGHELWVYDVRAEAMRPLLERQARPAASPRELAETCETVVVSLPTLEVFRAVLNGPNGLLAGKALKTLVNTCTVGVPAGAGLLDLARKRRHPDRCAHQRRARRRPRGHARDHGCTRCGQGR